MYKAISSIPGPIEMFKDWIGMKHWHWYVLKQNCQNRMSNTLLVTLSWIWLHKNISLTLVRYLLVQWCVAHGVHGVGRMDRIIYFQSKMILKYNTEQSSVWVASGYLWVPFCFIELWLKCAKWADGFPRGDALWWWSLMFPARIALFSGGCDSR